MSDLLDPLSAAADGMTGDQSRAFREIKEAERPGIRHLLIGDAGTGKTWLMATVAHDALRRGKSPVMTAPTHKAVSVLREKMDAAGLHSVPCRTIHALLSLRPKIVADRTVYERKAKADPVLNDVVVLDECSMLGVDLMKHTRRYLPASFVLCVGDPAQLPPVGEEASASFEIRSRSHLAEPVRQAKDNPILEAAGVIRRSQGTGRMDWTWAKSTKSGTRGIFVPSDVDSWMRKAFTSPDYDADPDSFRYLAWTNEQVANVNRKVRAWRYGDNLTTPFVPGERIMLRQPVMSEDGESILYNTNEEVDLLQIATALFPWTAPAHGTVEAWDVEIPTWRLSVRRPGDSLVTDIHMPRDARALQRVEDKIREEASEAGGRWRDLHKLREVMVKCQSVYALTLHGSQGSTFGRVFLDVPNIARRAQDNVLECQQLLYVGLTRPVEAAMLVT